MRRPRRTTCHENSGECDKADRLWHNLDRIAPEGRLRSIFMADTLEIDVSIENAFITFRVGQYTPGCHFVGERRNTPKCLVVAQFHVVSTSHSAGDLEFDS